MTTKKQKSKRTTKKKEESDRFYIRPSETDTLDEFAHAIVREFWLKNHPGKTEVDFEEQYRRELEAQKKSSKPK